VCRKWFGDVCRWPSNKRHTLQGVHGLKVGYARVSTDAQDLTAQRSYDNEVGKDISTRTGLQDVRASSTKQRRLRRRLGWLCSGVIPEHWRIRR
jgi:hypothetical protein